MPQELTRSERRLTLLVCGGILLMIGIRGRLTPVAGFAVAVVGGLLLRDIPHQLATGSQPIPVR